MPREVEISTKKDSKKNTVCDYRATVGGGHQLSFGARQGTAWTCTDACGGSSTDLTGRTNLRFVVQGLGLGVEV